MSERIIPLPSTSRVHERPPPGRSRSERPTLMTPRFAQVLACQACFGFAFSALFLLPTFLATELAAGPAEIGLLATITSFVTAFLMIGMGILVDRCPRKPLIVVVDSGPLYDPLVRTLRLGGVPVFPSADQAIRSLGRYLCHRADRAEARVPVRAAVSVP